MAKVATVLRGVTLPTGTAVGWHAAVAAGDLVVALVDMRLAGSRIHASAVVTLGPDGQVGRPLTIQSWARLRSIAYVTGRVLVTVTDSYEEDDGETVRMRAEPRVIDCGSPLALAANGGEAYELNFYEEPFDARAIEMRATSDVASWAMCTNGRFAYAFAREYASSDPVVTSLRCEETLLAAATLLDGSLVVLLGERRELALWVVPERGAPEHVAEVIRVRGASIERPRLIRLADGYVLAWFVVRQSAGSTERGLWARTCSLALDELSEPLRLARGTERDTWRAFDLEGEALMMWSGSQLHVRARSDLETAPMPFVGKLPDLVVRTPRGTFELASTGSELVATFSEGSEPAPTQGR